MSGRRSQRRANKGDGMIIGIALGVLVLMIVGAFVVYSSKKSDQRAASEKKNRIEKAREENQRLGLEYMNQALAAGADYIRGDVPDAKDKKTEIFASLNSNSEIINCIFERNYKDRRNKTQTEQLKMNSTVSYKQTSQDRSVEGTTFHTGESNDGQPMVVAKRQVPAKEGDKANLGGWVILMVKGVKEE